MLYTLQTEYGSRTVIHVDPRYSRIDPILTLQSQGNDSVIISFHTHDIAYILILYSASILPAVPISFPGSSTLKTTLIIGRYLPNSLIQKTVAENDLRFEKCKVNDKQNSVNLPLMNSYLDDLRTSICLIKNETESRLQT